MKTRAFGVAMMVLAIWPRAGAAEPDGVPPDSPAPPNAGAPATAPAVETPPTAPAPVDLTPAQVLEHAAGEPPPDHKVASAVTLAGIYAGFTTWTYFAWYRKHKPISQFKWGGDGWLGDRTYAGGADKFGHAWATMSLARAGTELLRWGGYDGRGANLVSTALAEALFIGVEVKDGFYYEFSFSDLTGDTIGALLGLALSNWPRLDELIDYRVEYWPSQQYRRQFSGGNVNIAEDYSGETYLLAFHLGAIHALRDARWGMWSRFVDVTLGFDSRGYKPDPPQGLPDYDHHQHLFLGVSLNAQGVFDWLLDRNGARNDTARKVTHGVFEVFNLPYTSIPILEHTDTPTGTVMTGGA